MPTGYIPLNLIELGHGSRLEQRHNGEIWLVTLTGEKRVEDVTDAKSLQESLAKLGVFQVPAGTSNWFAQGEGFGGGTVSTQTNPLNMSPGGPYAPDVKAAQEDPMRARAGTGDQDMNSTAISGQASDSKPREEEPKAARTTPEVQATRGGTAQPRRKG